MKNIYRIVLAALFVVPSAICNAQTTSLQPGEGPNGLEMSKKVTQIGDYKYQLDIEAFVTGSTTQTTVTVVEPVDIVMVLDCSKSMGNKGNIFHEVQAAAIQFAKNLYKNKPESGAHNLAIVGYSDKGETFQSLTAVDSDSKFDDIIGTIRTIGQYDQSTDHSDMECGLDLAATEFYNSTSGNKRYVVVFTDGSYSENRTLLDIELESAKQSVNIAYVLKQKGNISKTTVTYPSGKNSRSGKDYTIGCDATIYSVAIVPTESEVARHLFNFVSSNYPTWFVNNTSDFTNKEKGTEAPGEDNKYYKYSSNVDDLNDIFEGISKDITSGSASLKLTEDATTVIDVVSDSFEIPNISETPRVQLFAAPCVGKDEAGYTFGTEFSIPDSGEKPLFPNASFLITDAVDGTTSSTNGKVVKVNGFDFSTYYVSSISGTSPLQYRGYKLIIRFNIDIDPQSPGGANVATNEGSSGVYFEGKQISAFEQPNAKIPNIVIVKKGLKYGESAIFNVRHDSSVKPMTVVLTQTSQDEGDVQKVIKIQKPGRYSVTEDDWSWSYSTTLVSEYDAKDDDKGITTDAQKAVWKSLGYTEDGTNRTPKIPTVLGTTAAGKTITRNVNDFTEDKDAHGTLFIFENTKNTSTPAHAEAMKNNVFEKDATQPDPIKTNNK